MHPNHDASKTDFKKTLDCYRARHGEFRQVDVPPLDYLMIDGHGDPNTAAPYREAVDALFPVAWTLKFASKRELGKDYVVMPLEALWWADDMTAFTDRRDKSAWKWTVMIMVPDWIDRSLFYAAVAAVSTKRRPVALDRIRLETLEEGLCVQTLHVGSYDDETEVVGRLHDEHVVGAGLELSGRHHEIYLNDPRRVAPDKLRTIVRQPVTAVRLQ